MESSRSFKNTEIYFATAMHSFSKLLGHSALVHIIQLVKASVPSFTVHLASAAVIISIVFCRSVLYTVQLHYVPPITLTLSLGVIMLYALTRQYRYKNC